MPLNYYYEIEKHVWVRVDGDNSVTLGFTDVAQTKGTMLHVSYKPTDVKYPRGKSVAVIESAKWLGSLRTPIAGKLISVNETLLKDPKLINKSPYNRGWLVQQEPDNLEEDLSLLVTGEEAISSYENYMSEHNVDDCIHCEGFELP